MNKRFWIIGLIISALTFFGPARNADAYWLTKVKNWLIMDSQIENCPIGAETPTTGAFTTLTATTLGGIAQANLLDKTAVELITGQWTFSDTTTLSGLTAVTNATGSTSPTTGALVVTGGLGVGEKLYVGGDLLLAFGADLYMSTALTGEYGLYLKDSQADALSIIRGSTDMMVFDSSTPRITITPTITVTGAIVCDDGTEASSTTTGSIQTDGGLGVAKKIYAGADIVMPVGDLYMSTAATGNYEIYIKDNQADALSLVRGSTDMIVFNTSTPLITITPATTITGLLTTAGGIDTVGATNDITLKNDATIVNTSADLLTITEPTVTLAASTKINLDGATDITGILTIDTAGSPADGIVIAATTPVDGLEISSVSSANGINLSGANECAINVSVAQADETGLDEAAVFKHGTYSNALAYGAQTAHLILKSTSITASTTGATYVFGDINRITTSAASLGYMNVSYDYLSVGHDLVNGWATRGRVDITASSTLGEMSALLGTLDVAASTVIAANGAAVLAAGILDLQVNTGATIAQEVAVLEVRPHIGANIAGSSAGIRVNVNCSSVNYLDFGIDIRSMSAQQTAAMRILATPDTNALAVGIHFEGQDSSTSVITNAMSFVGGITNVLDFEKGDTGDGCSTSAYCDTNGQDSDGAIRIDVNGTPYYIAIWNAGHTSTSW